MDSNPKRPEIGGKTSYLCAKIVERFGYASGHVISSFSALV
jgi:hypothetical protein